MSKKFNIDKLNLDKIKKEIVSVPNLITNKSKIGFRSSTSFNHSRYNDTLSKESNNHFSLTPIFSTRLLEKTNEINNEIIQNETLFSKKLSFNKNENIINNDININIDSIGNKENNNIDDKDEIMNIINNNNSYDYIRKIINVYENKIKDISNIYNEKLKNLEKSYQFLTKKIQTSSGTYITLIEHNNIINNLNLKWKKTLSSIKNQYEKQISNLTNIMKYKEKYRSLLNRMGNYKRNEIEIKKIEEKLIENKIKKNKENEYSSDLYLLSQLSQEIEYNNSISELNLLYIENLDKLNFENMKKFSNLSLKVTQVFNNLIGINKEEDKKDLILITNQNDAFSYEKEIKKTKSNISKNLSSDSLNSKSLYNKSSRLSSEIECLNLSESSHQKPNNISSIIPLTKNYEEIESTENNNNIYSEQSQ